MNELLLFAGVMAFSAVFDIREMHKKKLVREIVVYCALCLAALALAVIYFPGFGQRSLMSYALELFGIKV
ncbi:MAG: hypothetical protein GX823_07365 [Clostridiales bacterium]|nr:hypothetical protein [Clostridiales bacterium]